MITLYQFGPAWDMPDPSPFVLKTMVYLELAGISYRAESGMRHIRNAPKGKLPYVRDGDTVVCDSGFIIDYLIDRYGDRLGADLTPAQQGALRGLTRMLDEDLYFVLVYLRWVDEAAWTSYTRPNFFGGLAWPMSSLVPWLLQRGVKKSLHGQGVARHSRDEIVEIGRRDLQAVIDYLGDKAFIAGQEPTTSDATVFAFLCGFADVPHESPLRDLVRSNSAAMAYLARMKERLPGL